MVSVTTIGRSFGGAVRYQFTGRKDQPTDKKPEILDTRGVRNGSAAEMIADFNMGRMANSRLGNAVWHVSLSFNPDDAARLDSRKMLEVAEGYLKKMGLDKTQYVIVRHHDTPDNQHLHIIANRVDDNGKKIADGRNFYRSREALRELIQEHGLTPPQGLRPEKQHLEKLTGNELTRHELKQAVRLALTTVTQLPELETAMRAQSMEVRYHRDKDGNAIGISFAKEGVAFKGSALDRGYSLKGIEKQLAANALAQTSASIPIQQSPAEVGETVPVEVHQQRPEQTTIAAQSNEPKEAQPQPVLEGRLADQAERQAAEVALAGMRREQELIEITKREADQAEQQGDYGKVLELRFKRLLEEEQRLADYRVQLEATPSGRTLLAELDDQEKANQVKPEVPLVPAVEQSLESERDKAKSPATEPLAEPFQAILPAAGEPIVAKQPSLPETPVTSNPAPQKESQQSILPHETSLQRGFILVMDTQKGSAQEWGALIQHRLTAAGAVVTQVPAKPGKVAFTYEFDPQSPSLERINSALSGVALAANTWVHEQPQVQQRSVGDPHAPTQSPKDWPRRQGQFNQVELVVDETIAGNKGLAGRLAASLRENEATVRLTQEEPGKQKLLVSYHTHNPKTYDVDITIELTKKLPGVQVQENPYSYQTRQQGIAQVKRDRGNTPGFELTR